MSILFDPVNVNPVSVQLLYCTKYNRVEDDGGMAPAEATEEIAVGYYQLTIRKVKSRRKASVRAVSDDAAARVCGCLCGARVLGCSSFFCGRLRLGAAR